MSVKYCLPVPVFHFWPKLTHPAARSLCDSWATCYSSRHSNVVLTDWTSVPDDKSVGIEYCQKISEKISPIPILILHMKSISPIPGPILNKYRRYHYQYCDIDNRYWGWKEVERKRSGQKDRSWLLIRTDVLGGPHQLQALRGAHSNLRRLCRWKFHIAGIGISTLFAPVTLALTWWPSYTNYLTRILWRYSMNFLRQGFRKLSSDRQTERHEIMKATTPLPRWLVPISVGRIGPSL